MLMPPQTLGFNYVTGNVITTRPTTGMGTSVPPGASNVMSAYVEILSDASVTRDCYRMVLCLNNYAANTAARDVLVTIGVDTAGGTSYVDLIPNLLASCAAPYDAQGGGVWYDFPIFIPAGTAIAAKAQVNNATAGNGRVAIWLYGAPTNPEQLVYGVGVEAIGVTTASSSGTAVTSGTTSDGAWTNLGTTTKKWIACQHGFGINNGTMAALVWHGDISYGDGTDQVPLQYDVKYMTSASEQISRHNCSAILCNAPAGATIYGRMQCSGTATSGTSMAAYGVY